MCADGKQSREMERALEMYWFLQWVTRGFQTETHGR
jgi:hypothetical protein